MNVSKTIAGFMYAQVTTGTQQNMAMTSRRFEKAVIDLRLRTRRLPINKGSDYAQNQDENPIEHHLLDYE